MRHEGCTEAGRGRETHSQCQANQGEHVEALTRATETLTALGDIIEPCQEHDPFWLILKHVNIDLQFVENRVSMEMRS